MRKKSLFILTVLLTVFIFGCTKAPKENEVYVVKENAEGKNIEKLDKRINTEGITPFYNLDDLRFKENRNQIPLAVSKDKQRIYYMKQTSSKLVSDGYIIKGESFARVDIMKLNTASGDTEAVVKNVPFVSTVKWNSEEKLVAFLGGNTLTVYNDAENKLIQSFQSEGDGITGLGWSPDGKKLYAEGQSLANTGIYYADSKKFVNSYETKETLFYKGILDDKYFYGTDRAGDGSYNTVIIDKDGKVVSRVQAGGRFKEGYKTSFLQTGKDNFGLEYYTDINDMDKAKVISKEFINDSKFIYNGGFVYITPNDNAEENDFFLHIVDSKGEEVKKLQVSGGTIMILPDGKTGYVGGEQLERIDFSSYTVERNQKQATQEEKENIFKTLRGAMDVIYKYQITGSKDLERVRKYITDSSSPEQWALTDVMNIFNDNLKPIQKAGDYNITLKIKALDISGEKATASLSAVVRNSSGAGMGLSNVVELIKRDSKWYVTGLSTFPASKQSAEVKAKVEALVKQAQQGKLFNGELKDKEIQIGQLQFWQLSEPHLADRIDTANYCKVYLKVKEGNQNVLYKLILDKKYQNYWKEGSLSKERLSMLF